MATDTIPTRVDAQIINATWYNVLKSALCVDFNPRDISGISTDQAGSLGTSTIRWLNAHVMNVLLYSDNTKKITLKSPASLAADYSMTLPGALPATTLPFQITSAGVMTFAKLPTGGITDAAITTVLIADSNVTTAKIADANVTTIKIADSNVTTAKIADANVTTKKIADANVTAAKIETNANFLGATTAIASKRPVVSNTNPASNRLAIVRGTVDSAGNITSGEGFTVNKTGGTGGYTMTFTTAFSDVPAVVVMPINNGTFLLNMLRAISASAFNISTFAYSGGAATDSAFSFIATGISAT